MTVVAAPGTTGEAAVAVTGGSPLWLPMVIEAASDGAAFSPTTHAQRLWLCSAAV